VTDVGDEGVERHLLVADPGTILSGFTHKVHMIEGWAISFRLLGALRSWPTTG
jgi:hypothetical protein